MSPDNRSGHNALDSVADFVKVTTSLGVGALVFAVGFLTASTTSTWAARIFALLAVIALFLCAFFGGLAQSRVVVLLSTQSYSITDEKLSIVGKTHQLTLMAGMFLLACSLASNIFAIAPMSTVLVPDAASALLIAKARLVKGAQLEKVNAVELVKGVDANNPELEDWHVQLLGKEKRGSKDVIQDIYINAKTGKVSQ